mgnify:FL=1
MKFKVGDKVRIRKDLKEGHEYKYYVNDSMEKLAGKCVEILEADSDSYQVAGSKSSWSEDMFEKLVKPTKEELLKMPVGTIIKTAWDEHNIFVKVEENDFCNDYYDHIEDDNINEDLSLDCCGYKIIEIQEPTYRTIYRAETEVKEMTLAEIEKELGYPIKVVKEEE